MLAVLFIIFALIPNAPTSSGFSSAGLGATRSAWERSHKADPAQDFVLPFSDPFYVANSDHEGLGPVYAVKFWPEGGLARGEARITDISTIYWSADSAGTPLSLIPKLLPSDTRLISTAPVPNAGAAALSIETYNSPSLVTRYPPRWFSGDPWAGTPPGTFYVLQRQQSLQIWIPAVDVQVVIIVDGTVTPTHGPKQ